MSRSRSNTVGYLNRAHETRESTRVLGSTRVLEERKGAEGKDPQFAGSKIVRPPRTILAATDDLDAAVRAASPDLLRQPQLPADTPATARCSVLAMAYILIATSTIIFGSAMVSMLYCCALRRHPGVLQRTTCAATPGAARRELLPMVLYLLALPASVIFLRTASSAA